jgi:hypothetical protein
MKPDEFPAISVTEHLKIKVTEKNSNSSIITEKVCLNKRVKNE